MQEGGGNRRDLVLLGHLRAVFARPLQSVTETVETREAPRTLLRSLRERLAEDLWSDIVEVPLQCAVSLSYFIEERAWRLRRLLER